VFENQVPRKIFGRRMVQIPEFGKYHIIWDEGHLISRDEIKNACRM
jgi:hypothetical protein